MDTRDLDLLEKADIYLKQRRYGETCSTTGPGLGTSWTLSHDHSFTPCYPVRSMFI